MPIIDTDYEDIVVTRNVENARRVLHRRWCSWILGSRYSKYRFATVTELLTLTGRCSGCKPNVKVTW